jgi:hypothetical protein
MIPDTKLILKPGKVLVKELGTPEGWNLKLFIVEDVAKNVNNFKKDFPVVIGDEVIVSQYGYYFHIKDGNTKFYIIDAGQILGVFKPIKNKL